MKKRRKILWAALVLVLCAGAALHWLNQDTEGTPLSPETAEALALLGLDGEETLVTYPEEVLQHLCQTLEGREFYVLHASNQSPDHSLSPLLELEALPTKVLAEQLSGDQLELEMTVFAVMDRERPQLVHNIRLLASYRWKDSPSALPWTAGRDQLAAGALESFVYTDMLSFFAVETTPMTRLDRLLSAKRMATGHYDFGPWRPSSLSADYPFRSGGSGVISLGLLPEEQMTLEELEGSLFLLQFSHLEGQTPVSGSRLALTWYRA